MSERDTMEVLERVLAKCRAEDAVATLIHTDEASVRFANSVVTQSLARSNARLVVKVAFGNRVGTAVTNAFSEEGLAQVVARAEEIARQSEPDTEYMPPVAPCVITPVDAFDEAVVTMSAAERTDMVRRTINTVVSHNLTAAGSLTTNVETVAMANSRGHVASHKETLVRLVCTAISPTSSGWASTGSVRATDLDPVAVAERAAQKALQGANPQSVEAKPVTVILEPAAVAELLMFLAWSLDAKAADEGRSAMTGRLGTTIGVPAVTIRSNPRDPRCPTTPFDEDGMPLGQVTWIDGGILRNLAHTRYWAQKMGRAFTGMPTNVIMDGGDRSLSEMITGTEDGLLVTRFWYIRYVDPMKLLLTGMTRDGLFQIKNGEVQGGVKNLRFNESPLRMLERVVGIGRPEPVWLYRPALVPPLKVEGFTFSSATAF